MIFVESAEETFRERLAIRFVGNHRYLLVHQPV
ncbi:MAG: hypothetical protein DVB23_001734 [Verrucomicrobia bacterium]|nr:MAG: hypothetical protein DVB23_001734 [Verrucomicrobiota bacterium]